MRFERERAQLRGVRNAFLLLAVWFAVACDDAVLVEVIERGPERPEASDADLPDLATPDAGPDAGAADAVTRPDHECGDGEWAPGEFCPIDPYFWPIPEGNPVKTVLADLDDDGRLDVITAVIWADAVFVQGGTGHFDHPISQRIDLDISGVSDVVAGDVDGDGDLDVVAAGLTGRAVQVLLNDGGALNAGSVHDVEGQAFTIDGGDFDEDGRFDVLVANFSRGGATVAFGAADGGLERMAHLRTGVEPHGAVAADVDADGHLDLVVANAGTHDPGADEITVRFGAGDGSFSDPLDLTVGNGPFHVAVGDLDRDGHPDIVAGNYGTPVRGAEYRGGDTVSVLMGRGGRRFEAARDYPCGDGPNHLVLADVDGDGALDVLTADRGNFDFGRRRAEGGGTISVLRGLGDGSLLAPRSLSIERSATGVAVGDLDRDGTPDLIGVAHDGRRLAAIFQRP